MFLNIRWDRIKSVYLNGPEVAGAKLIGCTDLSNLSSVLRRGVGRRDGRVRRH
jgi:hypothetical protein